MKKLLLVTLLTGGFITTSFASEPFLIRIDAKLGKYGVDKILTVISKENNIGINDIEINRGNCKAPKVSASQRAEYDKVKKIYKKLDDKFMKLAKESFKLEQAGYSGTKEKELIDIEEEKARLKSSKFFKKHKDLLDADLVFPQILKYGQKIQLRTGGFEGCDEILEVQINTDKGNYSYGFQ